MVSEISLIDKIHNLVIDLMVSHIIYGAT